MPLFGRRRKRPHQGREAAIQQPFTTPGAPPPYTELPVRVNQQQQSFTPTQNGQRYQNTSQYLPAVSSTQLVPDQPRFYERPMQTQQNWISSTNLPVNHIRPILPQSDGSYESRTELCNRIGEKLCDVLNLIDEEAFSGAERELIITLPSSPTQVYVESAIKAGQTKRALVWEDRSRPQKTLGSQEKSVNVFSKLDFYLNSRLPISLPPLRIYIPTYTLLCLAAKYSESAYRSPQSSAEKKYFISADDRLGTKAMVIKSVPSDDKKTITFAIRGTSMLSKRDWDVNLDTEPASPAGFLDDAGNLCHSGFLRVAKAMIRPIASRLRELIQENPNRTACSLLITGHSAGGAVASLLYAHMLSTTVQSELNVLTGCFKRVHCITFGAPPTSFLPLQKPRGSEERLRKCMFHSFMNEGDPVVRAERAYIRSLVDLLASPVPSPSMYQAANKPASKLGALGASMSRLDLTLHPNKPQSAVASKSKLLWWDVPPATFSNAGRLVVLRAGETAKAKKSDKNSLAACAKLKQGTVTASIVTDEQLRQVIFGDPLMHSMELYRQRVDLLAIQAITGGDP